MVAPSMVRASMLLPELLPPTLILPRKGGGQVSPFPFDGAVGTGG